MAPERLEQRRQVLGARQRGIWIQEQVTRRCISEIVWRVRDVLRWAACQEIRREQACERRAIEAGSLA